MFLCLFLMQMYENTGQRYRQKKIAMRSVVTAWRCCRVAVSRHMCYSSAIFFPSHSISIVKVGRKEGWKKRPWTWVTRFALNGMFSSVRVSITFSSPSLNVMVMSVFHSSYVVMSPMLTFSQNAMHIVITLSITIVFFMRFIVLGV